MRAFRFLSLAALSLILGSTALVYAQDDKQQDDHSARQEDAKPQPKQDDAKPQPKQDDARPQPRPDEAKPSRPADNPPKQEQRSDDRPMQNQPHEQAMPDRQDHPEQPGNRANAGQEHPEQAHGAPAGRGGRIPDDQFRAHFGHDHHFRAQGVIVAGQPQFQYSGYTFELANPWPAGWAYTDDCYIDYIDGEYFLFDLLHPGVRIALVVMM